MYSQEFYITDPVGNNAFSYGERLHKRLYVPALKKIQSFDEVELHPYLSPTLSWKEREQAAEKITFEEYDFNWQMQTCFGLKNLYEYNSLLNPLPFQGKGATRPKIYLVDNHNHVFYFWYLAREQGKISDGATLYHIDEHADTRDPWEYLLKPESHDLQKVFEYTNFTLNVGNYIIPAQREGLIGEVIQIRSEESLLTHLWISSLTPNGGELQKFAPLSSKGSCHAGSMTEGVSTNHTSLLNSLSLEEREAAASSSPWSKVEELRWGTTGITTHSQNIILNLDLDFFEPELDYIDYDLKKCVILDIVAKADLITVCTSPYFINQQRALGVFKDIFWQK